MLRAKKSKKRAMDGAELDLEEHSGEKKVKITPTPGILRLMKDIEALENEPNILLELCEEKNRVKLEYRVDQERIMHSPNRFEIFVAKRYPHEAPTVRCIDSGFVCRFIDEEGIVLHPYLREEWTAIFSLTNVVEAVQQIRVLFMNLNDPSAIETIDRSFFFAFPIPPPQRKRKNSDDGEVFEMDLTKNDEGEMTIVDNPHENGDEGVPSTLSTY